MQATVKAAVTSTVNAAQAKIVASETRACAATVTKHLNVAVVELRDHASKPQKIIANLPAPDDTMAILLQVRAPSCVRPCV